jgi:hypothetical protein
MEKIKTLRAKLFETFNSEDNVDEMRFIDENDIVTGTAFFPVGDGLFREKQNSSDLPIGGIMIVGQDFGVIQDLVKVKQENSEDKISVTWRNIKNIYFNDFQIPKNECFFTNALMGLRRKDNTKIKSSNPKDKVTGPLISYLVKKSTNENEQGKYSELIRKHRNFFIEQLLIQKPRIIIFMGSELIKFCNSDSISPELKSKIKNQSITKIKTLFTINDFTSINKHSADVLFLVHPCDTRNYGKTFGDSMKRIDIERKMVNEALKKNKFI